MKPWFANVLRSGHGLREAFVIRLAGIQLGAGDGWELVGKESARERRARIGYIGSSIFQECQLSRSEIVGVLRPDLNVNKKATRYRKGKE